MGENLLLVPFDWYSGYAARSALTFGYLNGEEFIPYLNGGLFENITHERWVDIMQFSADWFKYGKPPVHVNPQAYAANDYANMRFGLLTSTLQNGYFNAGGGFGGTFWYDEYSVDPVTGLPDDGTNPNIIPPHIGYLGNSLGNAYPLLGEDATNMALNPDFEENKDGWANINSSMDISDEIPLAHGVKYLRIYNIPANSLVTDASIYQSYDQTLHEYSWYDAIPAGTSGFGEIRFFAKSAENRDITVSFKDNIEHINVNDQTVPIGSSWVEYKIPFSYTNQITGPALTFYVGGSSEEVWLDYIRIIPQNINNKNDFARNLWRRNFQNGIVITNGTLEKQTNINLEYPASQGSYRKINGTQDSAHNDDQVWNSNDTIDMKDGYILLGQPDTAAPTAPPSLTLTNVDMQGIMTGILVDWSYNADCDILGYRIYRSLTQGTGYTQINPRVYNWKDSYYVDSDVQVGQTYYYKVKAIDLAGNESGYSPEYSKVRQQVTGGYTISGMVFNDLNCNGQRNAVDAGISNVTVRIGPYATVTGQDGTYSFTGLANGIYRVVETDLNGFSSTTPNQKSIAISNRNASNQNFGDSNQSCRPPLSCP